MIFIESEAKKYEIFCDKIVVLNHDQQAETVEMKTQSGISWPFVTRCNAQLFLLPCFSIEIQFSKDHFSIQLSICHCCTIEPSQIAMAMYPLMLSGSTT